MRLKLLGAVGQRGGIDTDAVLVTADHVALVAIHGGIRTVIGVHLSLSQGHAEVVWEHDVSSDFAYLWAGYATKLNDISVVAIGSDRAFIAGGTSRLLVDGKTGAVLVTESGQASPTAPAGLLGDTVVIPEGQHVAVHALNTLQVLGRIPVPEHRWTLAPVVNGLVPIEDELAESVALWHVESGDVWPVAEQISIRNAITMVQDVIVVPFGGGAPEYLVALNARDGTRRWRADFTRPEPLYPMSQRPLPFSVPCHAIAGQLLAVTAAPALVLLAPDTGHTVWRIDLVQQPATSLALAGSVALVGLEDGTIVAVDTVQGIERDRFQLPESEACPVSILALPASATELSAVVITRSGSIWHLTL